jgi:hypothetical protein
MRPLSIIDALNASKAALSRGSVIVMAEGRKVRRRRTTSGEAGDKFCATIVLPVPLFPVFLLKSKQIKYEI